MCDAFTSEGRTYYYEESTKKTTWNRPIYRPPPAIASTPFSYDEIRIAAALGKEVRKGSLSINLLETLNYLTTCIVRTRLPLYTTSGRSRE